MADIYDIYSRLARAMGTTGGISRGFGGNLVDGAPFFSRMPGSPGSSGQSAQSQDDGGLPPGTSSIIDKFLPGGGSTAGAGPITDTGAFPGGSAAGDYGFADLSGAGGGLGSGASGGSSAAGGSGGSALGGLGPAAMFAALIGLGKNTEANHPNTPGGDASLGLLGPSAAQIVKDPIGMGLPTLLGAPFLTPFTGSDEAKKTKPEWSGMFPLGF
jgi:hypothetical protein